MKCISIYPEYADEYLSGEKTAEYRAYPTKYRGPLLLAITATKQSNPFIFAVAQLVDCQKIECTLYKWSLEEITPIWPLRNVGRQRIYNVNYSESDLKNLKDEESEIAYAEATWIVKGSEK